MNNKLLICVNDVGYLHSHRKEIVKQAIESGFEVHIACPQALKSFENLDCQIHILDIDRKGMNPIREFKLLVKFYQLFKEVAPDVVFCITIKPYLYGGIAARLAKVPAAVYAVAGLGVLDSLPKLARKLLFQLYKLAFAHPNVHVIFQNLSDREYLVRNGLMRKELAYTRFFGAGVNLKEYEVSQSSTDKTFRFFFASRLLKSKGILDFLRAAEIVSANNDHVEFVIAGEPDFENVDSIEQATLDAWKKKSLPISFLGKLNRAEMIEQFQTCTAFVLPTYYGEGIPRVLIEASAIGRPSITTTQPGCNDIVQHETTGLLVEPRNVEQLVEAMRKLMANSELCQRFGLEARQWVELHSDVEKIAKQHVAIFETILQEEIS